MGKKKASGVGLGAFLVSRPEPVPVVPVVNTPPLVERLTMVKRATRGRWVDTRTFYCRHCGILFDGPPRIINHDPLDDPRWDISLCPSCKGANPFFIWVPRLCEHEQDHYTLDAFYQREESGIGYCNDRKALVDLDDCARCQSAKWLKPKHATVIP